MNALCCAPFCPLCGLTKYTVVGTALSLPLTVGMLATGPGDSQVFSPGHCHRYTEVRSQDCSSHAPGPAVGGIEAAQILAWTNPHMYVPTKPTATEARPIPAAGALVVLSNVSQALNLGSCQQRCNSVVHAALKRDFSSSSLVTWPLGLRCGFSPTCAYVLPTGVRSRGCRST